MSEKTIHCNYCNKDIAKRYYKMHTTTKTHLLKSGETEDPGFEWTKKMNILCDRSFPVFKKKCELLVRFNEIQLEIYELTKEHDKYMKLRDIKHQDHVQKGNITSECLVCLDKKEHFMRTLNCCNNPICFDCLIQCDKCPFCRFEFK